MVLIAIVSLTDLLSFCDVDVGYFTIDASHDVLILTYDGGSATSIDVDDGTYNGADLATELQNEARIGLSSTGMTVAYSSTTKKFTITAATTGETIAYTNTGSDAGLTFGFNSDHSAAISITSDLAAGDPSTILETIRDEVEDWIESYCHKKFESTNYSEYYSGAGEEHIQLDQYPITALTRVAIGRRTAIRVRNTSTATSATISVGSTGVVLTKDDVSATPITFAALTMSEMVAAINAVGSGWSATIESSDYSSFKSAELVEMYGKSTIDSNMVYLDMPDEAIDDFEVYTGRGELYRYGGWPSGHRNIFVKYTAGYSATEMPADLILAVKILCKYSYQRRNEESFGVKEYWAGDMRVMMEDSDFPKEAVDILSKHKRILI